ncbi:hypothetical protein B0H13DRAFT_2470083 [Mycena leptocephala]|nr:hypothetical protein B0H13DRAFT_2470083 [Mycena leptocephala]
MSAAPSGLSPIYAPEPLPSGTPPHRTSVRVLPLRWLRIEAGPETSLRRTRTMEWNAPLKALVSVWEPERTCARTMSHHNSKLRTSSATSPRKPKAQSSNGDSVIYVPRSFRGLVTVSSRNSSIRLPDALSVDLVTLSEMNNTRRCFMCHLVESSGSFLHPTETRLVRCSRTALSD